MALPLSGALFLMQARDRRHSEFRLQGGGIHADVDVSVVAHAADAEALRVACPEDAEGVVAVGDAELDGAD